MNEQWITIDEFPNYEVSNTGILRNKLTRKHIKPITNRSGYHQYGFRNIPGERPHTKCLHRYFATAFIPNPDNLPEVNHIDGIKNNNVITNLEWVSKSRNKKHAFEIGLCEKSRESSRKTINKINTGESNYNSKWCNDDITSMRLKYKTGIPRRELMIEYNISKSNICKILNNTSWKHLA